MLDLASLGLSVARERKAVGLRQIDLAKRAHVSRATIESLENGRTGELGFNKLSRIFEVLGMEFRIGPRNHQRPTLEDLMQENAENDQSLDRRR